RSRLRAVRDANGLGYDRIYTLRLDDAGRFVFAVTPHDDKDAFPGAPYPAGASPATLALMHRVADAGGPEATPPWSDEKDTWVSAFAPIRLRDERGVPHGEVVGLIEADVATRELRAATLTAARHVVLDSTVAALFAALLG